MNAKMVGDVEEKKSGNIYRMGNKENFSVLKGNLR